MYVGDDWPGLDIGSTVTTRHWFLTASRDALDSVPRRPLTSPPRRPLASPHHVRVLKSYSFQLVRAIHDGTSAQPFSRFDTASEGCRQTIGRSAGRCVRVLCAGGHLDGQYLSAIVIFRRRNGWSPPCCSATCVKPTRFPTPHPHIFADTAPRSTHTFTDF